jgi:hypothetical protein
MPALRPDGFWYGGDARNGPAHACTLSPGFESAPGPDRTPYSIRAPGQNRRQTHSCPHVGAFPVICTSTVPREITGSSPVMTRREAPTGLVYSVASPNGIISRDPGRRLDVSTRIFRRFPFGPSACVWENKPASDGTVAFNCLRCPVAEHCSKVGWAICASGPSAILTSL